jgi:amidophosphoribosyltransferase
MHEARDACGVVGMYSKDLAAARHVFFGLFTLQHRGQESAGITSSDGETLRTHKRMGLVAQVFNEEALTRLEGNLAIGHNRYSTTGSSADANAQPIVVNTKLGEIAVAHNGNLVNYRELAGQLKEWGATGPLNGSDSILIAHLIKHFAEECADIPAAVGKAYPYLKGSFSAVILSKDTVIGLRDRNGLRPLCVGRIGKDDVVIASESCALGVIEASFIREIRAGEMLVCGSEGVRSVQLADGDQKLCMFEYVYTSRPDSILMGQSVYQVRKRFGIELAKEYTPEADVVVPVPDTANPVAIGYSQATGLPHEEGLVKSRYINRTFIEPDAQTRHNKVRMKLTPLKSVVGDKRVVLIDDSIVRGTTSKKIIQLVKEAGAKEVHMLISSPPIRYPDFYGIDIADPDELIANNKTDQEIAGYIGADSIHYLSLEGTYTAIGVPPEDLETSCFTGDYPVWPEQLGEQSAGAVRQHPGRITVEAVSASG